ncbi:MAG: hypothetical protein HOC71_15975 [Candidatus Latescibacteria bacterium]|jgi:hypothetical protein|nr:hypothetical protein [Candidatus Latescibacterota bacterium]
MKKIIIFSIALSVLLITISGTVSADNNTIYYRNAKTIGMGSTRIAGGFNYNGFVDNPALLSRVPLVRFSLFNLPITLNKNLVDIGSFVNDNQENFMNFTVDEFDEFGNRNEDFMTEEEKNVFLKDVEKQDGKWSRVNVSPMVDFAVSFLGQSIGLAVFNVTDVGIKIDRGIYEPRVWGKGNSSVAAVLGYSRPLTYFVPGLTVGINLKYMERRRANLFQIKASDLGNTQETFDPITEEVKNDKFNTLAMDIGALYDIPIIDSEIGAAIRSIGDGRGASVDIGIAKRMYNDNLLLLADYIDLLDMNKENVFNKLHFGAELSAQVIKLRAGLNSGYPTAGLGLNFRVVDIDAAYFFDELGNAPGKSEDARYVIQFKLGW